MPPPDAWIGEGGLHDAPLNNPRKAFQRLSDARENWEMMIAWRDHLLRHRTLEAAHLDIVWHNIRLPHVFMAQLTQVILRNLLDDCADPSVLRAIEVFFRPQKVLSQEDSVIVIDAEIKELDGQHQSPTICSVGIAGSDRRRRAQRGNVGSYFERSDSFDMALDLTPGQGGLTALGEIATRWLSHLLAIDVAIEPLRELQDEAWSRYVGLDSDATRIGDTIWNGGEFDHGMRARLIGLFRLTFRNPSDMMRAGLCPGSHDRRRDAALETAAPGDGTTGPL
jgi:hypothetical protein